jgi:1-acyl-sn-glycerol-3-phosphate acyltransferase
MVESRATEEIYRASTEKGSLLPTANRRRYREIQATQPGQMRLDLEGRKGLLRIARAQGVPIVPVLSFGENEIFPPSRIHWVDHIQGPLKRWLESTYRFLRLEALVNWGTLLRKPSNTKVETWVGEPISTKEKTLEVIQNACV